MEDDVTFFVDEPEVPWRRCYDVGCEYADPDNLGDHWHRSGIADHRIPAEGVE